MVNDEKTITKKSTETKTHTIVKKPRDLWREKERQRLLDQAKIEEFERAERRARLPKTFFVFLLMTASVIVAVYQYYTISTDYSVIKPAIKILRNGTTEEKLEAIDFLGSTLNPKAIGPLIKAYPDEDESVNIAILETLEGHWDGRCIKPLSKAMSHKDSTIRRSAIISLGKRSDHRVVPILFEALSDKDEKVRELAFIALSDGNGKLNNKQELQPLLKGALFDKDVRVRELIARSYSNSPYAVKDEINYFIPLLKDRNSNVRKYMIKAIANCGYAPNAVDPLIDAFTNDEDVLVRTEAARALSAVGISDHKALDYLKPVVLDDIEDPEVIRAAIYSIIIIYGNHTSKTGEGIHFGFRSNSVVDFAIELKKDKYLHRHPLYVKAASDVFINVHTNHSSYISLIFLKNLGHPDAVPVLITAFKGENTISTNRAIIETLGEFGDPRAIRTLISTLDDPDAKIREGARLSLKKITGQNFGKDPKKWRSWLKENENSSIN